jgi:hypothetical protein
VEKQILDDLATARQQRGEQALEREYDVWRLVGAVINDDRRREFADQTVNKFAVRLRSDFDLIRSSSNARQRS